MTTGSERLQRKLETLPEGPGVYVWKDAQGEVLYVGKARRLRSRVRSYLQPDRALAPKDELLRRLIDDVETIVVEHEAESLLLENNLIKEYQPRFNVRLKDDKSYPFLAITLDEEWPRALGMRGRKRKGVRYFGPYAHAYAIRDTLDLLLRTFPIRTCTKNKFDRHARLGRVDLCGLRSLPPRSGKDGRPEDRRARDMPRHALGQGARVRRG